MTETSPDLPPECWELIFTFLDHHRHFEPLSLVSTRFLSITDHLRRTLSVPPHLVPLLPRLIHRFPNLKAIQFPDLNHDLDSILCQISKSDLEIESLEFSNQTHFPILGLKALGSAKKNLSKLSCSKVSSLQDIYLIEIGDSFPLLEDLNISFPQYNSRFDPTGSSDSPSFSGIVTDDGIIYMTKKLDKLRRIDLSGNHFITDKSLQYLSLNCVLLKEIVIRSCDFITQNGIGVVLRNCANLSSITLDAIGIPSIDSYFEESFAYAKSLCEIHLSSSFISDEFLCVLAQACLPLKKLSIALCFNFTFVGLHSLLCKCPSLVYLDVEGANFLIDDSVIEISKLLCKLSFINLNSCAKLTSLSFFALVKNCPLLEEVNMDRTNLGVEEYSGDLTLNPRIRTLILVGNNSLSDEFLKKIAFCCPNLQVLDISLCPTITEEGTKSILRNCGEIRHLEINRCMGIKYFDISFQLPKLEVLHLQGPGIDDEALAIIAKRCQMLLDLNLEGCLNVTEKGVNEVVQNCTRLKEINLKWCDNVKDDSIASMIFSRPSLRKITPPYGFMLTDNQISFFLRHGCLVCRG